MSLRTDITGTFDRAALTKLSWPVAWSGTVSAERRASEEADRADLVSTALGLLDTDPDAASVEIEAGEIVGIVVA